MFLDKMEDIYSFWGKHPGLYKIGCAPTFMFREKYLRRKAVESLGLKKGDTVLDLACGTGLNFSYLQEAIGPEGKLIGFDHSKEMLHSAEQKINQNQWKNVELRQGNAAELSLENKVDAVLSTLGISAISNHYRALERTVETIQPKGRIVILDAQPFSGEWAVLNPLIKKIFGPLANWDYNKDIPGDLQKIIGSLKREEYNLNTIYIITGTKK